MKWQEVVEKLKLNKIAGAVKSEYKFWANYPGKEPLEPIKYYESKHLKTIPNPYLNKDAKKFDVEKGLEVLDGIVEEGLVPIHFSTGSSYWIVAVTLNGSAPYTTSLAGTQVSSGIKYRCQARLNPLRYSITA